ncbi:LamG-like jellyroll fold domain-containing protein [Sedimentisphaera salicampi]|uniref:LamG-like jellyroll fold domain-containing protein n=1 Tax=Sedimentisphaera salicampi TaxID=1941349 RepID=UPI00137482E9|nr:LamG-like jellyroll fold domain-containing protein [Sedimentisphaera salicampi]
MNQWSLYKGSGTEIQDSGYAMADGVLSGSAAWVTDDAQRGTCIEFPASGYPGLDIPGYHAVQGINPFTVTGWINTTDSNASIIGWGDPFNDEGKWWPNRGKSICVAVSGDSKLRVDVFGGMKATQAVINDGQWHHFAVVVEENDTIGEIDIYLDGALQTDCNTETEGTEINIEEGQAVNMGWGGWSPWFTGFEGFMDDMRIYDEALDASGVQADIENKFVNIFPQTGQTEVALDSSLDWQTTDTSNFSEYSVFFGSDPNNLTEYTVTGDTSFSPSGMVNETTYYWQVQAEEGGEAYSTPKYSFTTLPFAPIIVSSPEPQYLEQSQTAQFSIEAENIEMYAWFKEGSPDPLSNTTRISGANSDTLTIENVSVEDEGYYYCQGLSAGFDPAVSDSARLMTFRLAGHWKLNSNLEDSVDENIPAATTHGGVINDPNYIANGIDGEGVEFFGDNRPMIIQESTDYFNFYPYGFTVNMWVKTDDFQTWRMLMAKFDDPDNQGWFISTAANGNQTPFYIFETSGDSQLWPGINLADNQWHMVTAQYDPAPDAEAYRLFIDGELIVENSAVAAGNLPVNDQPLVIGAGMQDWDTFFGMLDDVRIYNYPLSKPAVAQLFFDLKPDAEPFCYELPEYDLNEDCKVDLQDLSLIAGEWMVNNIMPDTL